MPTKPTARAAMARAREQEKVYDWLAAANSYRQTLQTDSKMAYSKPEILERIGFCYQLASRQAENLVEFKKLAQLAVKAYKSAAGIFGKEKKTLSLGKSLRQYALAEYVCSWLASSPSEKKEKLIKSCELADKSLNALRNVHGGELDYAKASNDILECLLDRFYVASDSKEMKNVAEKAITRADEAVAFLSKSEDKSELVRTYFLASLLGWYTANFGEMDEKAQKELIQKNLDYSQKALELSKGAGNPYYAAMSNFAAAFCTLVFTEKAEMALEYSQEMLDHATRLRDNYLKGVASYVLTFATNWMMVRETDPDRKKELARKLVGHADEAIQSLSLVAQDFFIAETHMFYAESFFTLGQDVETSSEERRTLLQKAVDIGRKALELANRSGSPDATGSALHALSKALYFYSNMITEKEEKTRLLEEALDCRREFDKIVQKAFPSNAWLIGVTKNYQGSIKADLARIELDHNKKRTFLESAVSDMEDGIATCRRWISSRPIPTQIVTVASFEDKLGIALNDLYLLTKDETILIRAVGAHEQAAARFKKLGMPSRTAESYWKMARDQNRLGKHQKAAENFLSASQEYAAAAQNTPNFAGFYQDYVAYMKAWSEIEKAYLAHECEKYADAVKHYETVARILNQTKTWSYLSPDFLAWSVLERAEDLSRKENSVESMNVFGKAAELFKETKRVFRREIDEIQNPDEKGMAIELDKASDRRQDYCMARICVEEARTLDRQGEHTQSAEKYDSAADLFENMLKTADAEADRREIEPFYYVCRAWQKMKMADKSASPDLYREASELFLKAKEHSTKDETILLVSGNSSFCKALENGTEFEATREKDHFTKTKQYLESAADYYMRAGFDNASLWTNATEMLFDAYNYMINAEIEADPQKKTKTYLLAEKCLERSAELYGKAGYTGKEEEVQKTLRKVVEKREFAISLGKLFTAPDDVSSTHAVSAPRLTVEEPVGLLKFEQAFLQANLIIDKKEILVGESLSLEVQLVNSGKDAAFLTKAKDILPDGFEVIEKPEKYVVQDTFLNLKGRRLAPLETDEIKIKLRPKKKGQFTFAPTVQFMNEAGEHKLCKLEQVEVTVKEMGIRSWLRGQ